TKARMLHTMIRVFDLDKSIDFYVRLLGMKLIRRNDYPGGRYTLAFVGYGEEKDQAVIELTHNGDQAEPYAIGSGFGHLALGVAGVKIPRPAGPVKHGTTVIAFIEDPDVYKIELIDRL